MDWQTIGGVAALITLVPALAGLYGLYIAWRSEQRQRGEQEEETRRWEEEAKRQEKEREEEARRWEEEAKRQEKEREEEARRREREARERERKTIVSLIGKLKPHRVLGPELDHVGEYYGRPELMKAAVNNIRDDLVYAGNELGENHKDIPLLQTMTESCNEFLTALEKSDSEDFTFGGPDYYRAIEEKHNTFIEDMGEKKYELEQRNDIKS